MLGVDDDGDAARLERRLNRVRDLVGQDFLALQPPRIRIDNTRNLGNADDFVWTADTPHGRPRSAAGCGARNGTQYECP